MSTAANSGARIKRVEVTDERITAHLADGRVISVPLAWSWNQRWAMRYKIALLKTDEGYSVSVRRFSCSPEGPPRHISDQPDAAIILRPLTACDFRLTAFRARRGRIPRVAHESRSSGPQRRDDTARA